MMFKPGQKLVCVADGTGHWRQETNLSYLQYLGLKSRVTLGPKFNEIVTVDVYRDSWGGISLKEYDTYSNGERNTFHVIYFKPLVSDAVLEAELSTCREPNFV